MRNFTATDLKNRLGDVADEARAGPVVITRNGRPDLVLLSARAFALLQKESDLVWGTAAGRAHAKGGYLSVAESATMLRRMMEGTDGRGVGGGAARRAKRTEPAKKRPAQSRRGKIAVAAE